MNLVVNDAGSFRDPSGHVYLAKDKVYRTVMPSAVDDFDFVRSTGLISELVSSGRLIPETIVDREKINIPAENASYVLEHPILPFISYPYEWPFGGLKAAALLHLDIHLAALDHGVTLSDSTAYNIQFRGPNPIFIDSLSFKRYREGEFWLGHQQFCEQFLNPLLLRALVGIPHNGWYRGEMEGISAESLSRVLPSMRKLSPNVLTHVVLQAKFQSRRDNQKQAMRVVKERHLPLAAFKHMLKGLRRWIARLQPYASSKTVWQDYARENSYSDDESEKKRKFIKEFAKTLPGAMLWDIGCNTGDYAGAALTAGVGSVIGFDCDQGALELAFCRAKKDKLNFQPLFLDAANPPPDQGWAQNERRGLTQRANADGLLALALIHHLAIGKNIPLAAAVKWLVGLAPTGVIEFVPKSDPMVETMLQLREDIFDDYSEESFVRLLQQNAIVVRAVAVSKTGRRLYLYKRFDA